jgi:hypothetical protein
MLIFTVEGPRSVDQREVLQVYRGQTLNRFAIGGKAALMTHS